MRANRACIVFALPDCPAMLTEHARMQMSNLRLRHRAIALALTSLVYVAITLIFFLFPSAGTQVVEVRDRLTAILLPSPPLKPPERPPPPPSRKPTRHPGTVTVRKDDPAPPLLPEQPAPAVVAPIVDLPKVSMAEVGLASDARSSSGRAESTSGAGGGAASGNGSGGGPLYDAQWLREPSHEELMRYMPRDAPPVGWGLIACRTRDHYRVTDCELLDEFPKGSGIGRAVRDAAHQFRVKPPMVDGKPQVGAWVRIRIGYYNPPA